MQRTFKSPARTVSVRGSVKVRATAAPSTPSTPAAAQKPLLTPFAAVKSEKEFFTILKGAVAQGKIPEKYVPIWEDFYQNYKAAVLGSGIAGRDEQFVASVLGSIADRVLIQAIEPYTFPSHHERILAPYNYYQFGQTYVGALINYDKSFVGHLDRWMDIQKRLDAGENVILLANHQTEADPGVFALLLEAVLPKLATDVIYVAGDRVVTDPLCKPFSMGRNLLCVYSKRRMEADTPDVKSAKMSTNRKTLVAMQRLLNEGGKLIWVAPSGGRDRPKDGKWIPDTWDPASVGLFIKLMSAAKKPTAVMPMAMWSWKLMPPPVTLDKEVGERRMTYHTGVGISVCEPLDVAKASGAATDPEQVILAITEAAHAAATAEYVLLDQAIEGGVSTPTFTQPWKTKN